MVAALGQDVLLLAARLEADESVLLEAFALRLLVRLVERPAGRRLDVEFQFVGLAVGGGDAVGQVVDRAADQRKVVEEQRRREGQFQVDIPAREGIVRLRGLHVDGGLHGGLFERRLRLFRGQQAEVQQTVAHRIAALGGDQVFALAERRNDGFGEFHHRVLVAGRTGIMHFDAVHVEDGIVVVGKFQEDLLPGHILVERHRAAHPDVFGRPVGLGRRFVDLRAEGPAVALPRSVVVGGRLPVAGGLHGRPAANPLALLRGRNDRQQFEVLSAHETVGYAVDLQGADQREVLAGPVFDRTVVEVVGHRPGAGVGVDRNERIGRGPQFALDNFARRRSLPGTGGGSEGNQE